MEIEGKIEQLEGERSYGHGGPCSIELASSHCMRNVVYELQYEECRLRAEECDKEILYRESEYEGLKLDYRTCLSELYSSANTTVSCLPLGEPCFLSSMEAVFQLLMATGDFLIY